jgi:hypothetical protein
MYRNYENRVREFIIDMTHPHSIIEQKDITQKITNTRLETMNELFKKNPKKKKPLVFRGYLSEADRIKDTIRNQKYLFYNPDYETIKNDRKKLKNSISMNVKNSNNLQNLQNISTEKINNNDKILNINYKITSPNNNTINTANTIDLSKKPNLEIYQPTMRYKARTDLERVYDVINGYNFDEKSKDIIERQLKSINLYDFKRKIIC